MPRGAEMAYAYAKACGIIGKSFVGKRIRALGEVRRLSELDRLIFQEDKQELPERELLPDLEDRIIRRSVQSIIAIVDCFSHPPEVLLLLLRSYEYQDLQNALVQKAEGETKKPEWTSLGPFGTVHFDAWPDIPGMIRGTEFEFLLEKDAWKDPENLQNLLDRRYYQNLWKALLHLPRKDRVISEKLLGEEISLLNAGWVLRLRTYYGMNPEEVKDHLVYIPEEEDTAGKSSLKRRTKPAVKSSKKPSLAREALECLEFSLDNREEWASWRWASFLNPPPPEGSWEADPRFFQNAAANYLYQAARHAFHFCPFSLDTIFCFIKLKSFEEDLLTSDAEGLGLGFSSGDVLKILEAQG